MNLQEPIFNQDNYKLVLSAHVEEYNSVATNILKSLPILQYEVLSYILGFMLYRVVSEEKFNRMSIYNVSVVMAPCLFRPK